MPRRDYLQIEWNERLEVEAKRLAELALEEDLHGQPDWTTDALVPADAIGSATISSRQTGVVAGIPLAEFVCKLVDPKISVEFFCQDGAAVEKGTRVLRMSGPARSLLVAERTVLNFLGRLSGIASLTQKFVQEIRGTKARIYDTRKTTPGWRLLEKYAVRQGGGFNHRLGLGDSLLIKDNHLAFGRTTKGAAQYSPAEAIERARKFAAEHSSRLSDEQRQHFLIEIEVDSLDQLNIVLPARPDVVLLDNMKPDMLREAVRIRDANSPAVELEASGGVTLASVRVIAATGVDRISSGALTHSAIVLDLGLDWDES
jgi:nicotinate-nucleotide pyrophosphorylase (carboxylating)